VSELSLTWTPLGDKHEANIGHVRIEATPAERGYLWSACVVFSVNDESFFAGSFDDEGTPIPLPSLLGAQLAAEHALRSHAAELAEHLGLSSAQLERLGLRRAPVPPTEAGEIDPVDLVRNLRELVEAFGAVWIEGVVASVRETTARCLHFILRVSERGSYQCRISSTTARLVTRPREGERVKLRVVPTIYEKRGDVQFDVFEVKESAS
jgi:hypothetical protein